jgi:hypothetical protein
MPNRLIIVDDQDVAPIGDLLDLFFHWKPP